MRHYDHFQAKALAARKTATASRQISRVDYFFDFTRDYHLVDYIVWKTAGAQPDVFRLYRKQGEDYEFWLREFAEEHLHRIDNRSSFQMYGTGFVVNKDFVVTADHILRDKPSGRQCNNVDVLTYPCLLYTSPSPRD